MTNDAAPRSDESPREYAARRAALAPVKVRRPLVGLPSSLVLTPAAVNS